MRKLFAFAPLMIAACSTMPAEGSNPSIPGGACRNDGLSRFVGREATSEVGAELLRQSGARTLRWVAKGSMITMEFREDRVTAWLDANNRIERVNCG